MAAASKIFLSYARADHARVEGLALALEQAGHEVWWDRRIGGGAEFAREIEAALAVADIVLVAWSAHSTESHWVRDEAAAGRDTGRLLPVTLDGSHPPLGFRQFQTIDLSRWNGRPSSPALKAVLEAVDRGGRGEARKRLGAPTPVRSVRVLPLAASIAAVAAAGGAALLFIPTESKAEKPPQLEITRVEGLSPSLPSAFLPNVRQEVRTALANDNAIAVTSSGEKQSDARFSLDATVNTGPEELKFAVEVSDRKSGTTLWSRILDIPLEQAEVAPRQVAYKIAQVVRCGLSADSQKLDPHALSLWFRYCDELWGKPDSSEDSVLTAARKVTEAAPEFSPAWSARAIFTGAKAQVSPEDAEALRADAADAAKRALKINPQNGEAYAAMANLLRQRDHAGREALLRKAVNARPTDCFCETIMYAQFLLSVGRLREAFEYFRRVHDMRPLSPVGSQGQVYALFTLGRNEDAQLLLKEARALWPDDFGLNAITVRSSFWTGNYDDALAVVNDPDFKVPQPRRESWREALEALKSGSDVKKRAAVEKVLQLSRTPNGNNLIGIAALRALGAKAEALDAARRFIAQHRATMVLFEPTFDGLRDTREFAQLLDSIGLTRYWAQSGRPADFCGSAATTACRAA